VNTQDLKSILIGIVANLITPFVIPTIVFLVGLLLPVSVESKIALLNTTLLLFLIFLLLHFRFSPRRPRVVRQTDRPEIYLIEERTYRHIPDRETFIYLGQFLGFRWSDVEVMTPVEFGKQFSAGSMLPSIRPHCETYCDKSREEASRQGNPVG
jgi:hypothetical protein